ncbi:MAG: copper homeostasis protein CutC [Bacteroidales bacterium]|nr:copper homeostasis protein CutC [Bacteroidales bacterium]
MIDVEICCNSVASAEAAKAGGARRIELCRDLECGGLTPSDGDIAHCVRTLGLRTHVLVRPRPGDFCYNDAEIIEIEETLMRCRTLGASAVVVGFLTAGGLVDEPLTRHIVRLAAPMEVTFHRAFDEARQEPLAALAAVARCGCHRLLTSGQAPSALEGAAVIRRLVEARSGVKILAGGGVTPDNAGRLLALTGVGEVHGSCKVRLPDGTVQTSPSLVEHLIDNTRI